MESDDIRTFLSKILSAATPQSSATDHSNSVAIDLELQRAARSVFHFLDMYA